MDRRWGVPENRSRRINMPQPALDTHAEVRKLKQAGCPEEQAEAMVELVSRAPLNAQIVSRLERLESKVDDIEANMATRADLASLRADMVERVESLRADMTERVESLRAGMTERVESLRADGVELNMSAKVSVEALRAQMVRMMWVQSLALATLIISMTGIMISLAG
ncbi:MAG: DUF1640 domain-containing protein [Gammaproteobacteria bacterium]|nr:DUF1640 domain-containing protein [Gammaproteobacteria bacterium]MXW45169.1 DUF1640 domain-containing protein [Gammaproteobacteria bacterium]MYD01857.1 DUF1640 domain-containing protein [Gammaproteobacteria bacterium]MYI26066.1 DUF1640 domain-containing protein [Gammaproteobacteria bacterium]